MSDDIEIEEHDLLDDPTVRNIFPDIARLKQEILDYENSGDHEEPKSSTSHFDNNKEVENDSDNNSEETVKHSEILQGTVESNKLHDGFIRGEKGIEVQVHNNKIILGTKPAGPVKTKSEHFEKHVKPYCAVVGLEDFGLYLNNSSRYCKQCLIFFPTISDYNIHKQKIHIGPIKIENVQEKNAPEIQSREIQKISTVECTSQNKRVQKKTNKQLVRIVSKNINICLVCNITYTRKGHLRSHMIRVHNISKEKLSQILPDRRISERNECFHCKKRFRTQNLLIEHIYSILQTPHNQADKLNNKMVIGNKTNKEFTLNKVNKIGSEIKKVDIMVCAKNSNVIKENKNKVEKMSKDDNNVRNVMKLFQCNFCFVYFKSIRFFVRHMSIKHKTVKNFQTSKGVFDPKCKYCPKTCDSMLQYNRHLYKSHRQSLIEAIKDSRKALFNRTEGTNVVTKDFSKNNYFRCDHCFLYFSNIPYYYRHMTIKHKILYPQSSSPNSKMVKFDPKCPYCPKTCYNLSSFNKHLCLNHTDKVNCIAKISSKTSETISERASSMVTGDDIDMEMEYYSCNYCCLYFKTTKFLHRHMAIKHKIVKPPQSKKVKFTPKCKFCPKICNTIRIYNDHIVQYHFQISNQVIKIPIKAKVNANKVNSSNNIKNLKGKECFKCNFCPSYFMTMKYYIKHMKVRHKMAKMPKPAKAIFDCKCKYCPAILNDIKIHNKHLYNNHYDELKDVIERAKKAYIISTKAQNKKHANVKKIDSTITLYRCCYCSHYFKSLKYYNNHVMKKHKVLQLHEVKKVPFDPKCKYCSTVAPDDIAYNKHLYGSHKIRINEVFKDSFKNKKNPKIHALAKEEDIASIKKAVSQSDSKSMNIEKSTSKASSRIVPVSKSALFKCHKCDIHFLTIKSALDHSNHMELLINWKCALCHRIFKDNDRCLHEKQHLFSHVFTVYDIDQSNISQILYKCSKCFMHFDESVVDNHHYECALKVPQSYKCKICDIFVDNKAQICHEYNHKHRNFTSNDFIIIETAAIREEINKNKRIVKDKNITESLNMSDRIDFKNANNQGKGKSSHSNVPKKSLKRKINDVEKDEDVEPKKIKKDQIAVTSKAQLKSGNEIINYSSGVSIQQQRHDKFLLKLSFCNTCKSFVSMIGQKRNAHAQKRCAHLKSIVCKDCGLKLSCKTMSTHKQMHSRIKNLELQHFKFYDFKSGKRVNPPMPEYEKCGICDVNFISKGTLGSHVCSEVECKVCYICKIKIYKPAYHLHMAFHKYRTDETNTSAPIVTPVEVSKINKTILLLLYCCKVCYIFIDTYDHLVEHCQKHCLNNLSPHTEECNICNLPFEKNCLKRHAKIHELAGVSSFEKLFFDPFYFRFDHTVWSKHIFGSHSHLKKEDILLNSVYRHEHRFKMEIAQEGSPELTIYKCIKCNRHVEADDIYQHVQNLCSDLTKYSCPICKLDFISSSSLQRHKTIHKDSMPRRYRIIHFNKQDDAELTKVILSPPKLYVLYQCRHCNVVVGSAQRISHKCNKKAFASCSDCGLLINEDIYELHSSMHKTLDSFVSENIEVILFGQYQSNDDKFVALKSSFRGKIHDYTFYKCNKCKVCVKHKILTLNHTCCWKGQPRVACSICGLYFYADELFSHIKNHETDPNFILDNMTFIEYHPLLPASKDNELQNKTCEKESSLNISTDLNCNNGLKNVEDTGIIVEKAQISESAKNTAVYSENAEDTEVDQEIVTDTIVNSQNVKVNAVNRESTMDVTVSQEIAKDSAASFKITENTTIVLEGVKDVGSLESEGETVESVDNTMDSAGSLESAMNTGLSLEIPKDTRLSLESASDSAGSLETATDTALSLEIAKESGVSLESVKDTKVSVDNPKDAAVSLESAKDTGLNLENTRLSLETAKDTAGSLETAKDTTESLEIVKDTRVSVLSAKDTGVSLENPKDTRLSLESARDTADSLETAKDTGVSQDSAKDTGVNKKSAKDTEVSKESAKDIKLKSAEGTAVCLENAKDTVISRENAQNIAGSQEQVHDAILNRPHKNNIPVKQENRESEKTADIYKCRCGLHFLDEKSITEHFSQCGSKSKQAKQNCSKCGLLFTPNVLFKHLLTHHGDKNNKFKINIIEKLINNQA